MMAAVAAVCGVSAVAAANGELPPGAQLGTEPVFSDVQFRALDSFWRGNSSHIDLYNVRLETTTVGGGDLDGSVLKIFVENEQQADVLKKRLATDGQLLP